MKVALPEGQYIKKIDVNDDGLDIQFADRKRIALLLIGINERYWPYLFQVIEDAKKNFLPQHKVDFLVWSDMDDKTFKEKCGGTFLYPTDKIEWPAPTLMRYHLFLQQEEKLKEYDYVFYLDADMRVVEKISDEVLGKQLTAAPHPGYVLNSRLLPPYEPNKNSSAYIHRLGRVTTDEKQNTRFIPFYAAGGFQGGVTADFIESMKVMKDNIDADFNKNYVAIWNDESHWNRYLWDFQQKGGDITFLDVSYVYPDSLIKEYYEPIWGRSYQPKIITITKPFSLTKKGAEDLNEYLGKKPTQHARAKCPQCQDEFDTPGYKVKRIIQCPGAGRAHQLDLEKI